MMRAARDGAFAAAFAMVLAGMFSLAAASSVHRFFVLRPQMRGMMNAAGGRQWTGEDEYPLPERSGGWIAAGGVGRLAAAFKVRVEGYLTDGFRYRMPFVLAKKTADRTLGLDMTASVGARLGQDGSVDTVVPFAGAGRTASLGQVKGRMDIVPDARRVAEFARWNMEAGRKFLFFETPGKFAGGGGFADHSDELDEELARLMEEAGVDHLRVRNLMPAGREEYAAMFYRTDHHWLASSGIWACGVLCRELNARYGWELDDSWFEPEMYEKEDSGVPFLGSLGKKATEAYVEPDGFAILRPRYESDVTAFNSYLNREKRGSIGEVLFWPAALRTGGLYQRGSYAFYGWGDLARCTIRNNLLRGGRRLLIIKTSFADCMYPFLCMAVGELDVLDIRHFNGSVRAYVEAARPDAVVLAYGISGFGGAFAENDAFDFR